jgi:hypothetical protein
MKKAKGFIVTFCPQANVARELGRFGHMVFL